MEWCGWFVGQLIGLIFCLFVRFVVYLFVYVLTCLFTCLFTWREVVWVFAPFPAFCPLLSRLLRLPPLLSLFPHKHLRVAQRRERERGRKRGERGEKERGEGRKRGERAAVLTRAIWIKWFTSRMRCFIFLSWTTRVITHFDISKSVSKTMTQMAAHLIEPVD